jgi:seryl-tRNA synthetase
MKCRFKNAETGKTVTCHTLNGSSLALPRIVAALLENGQGDDGIKLPAILHGYFGKDMIS